MRTAAWTFRMGWHALLAGHGPWAAGFLALLSTAMVLAPALVPVAIIGSVVSLVTHHRGSLRWAGRRAWMTPHPYALLFYLWHVVAMAWTDDTGFGLFDLEIKLPLLVLPVLAMLLPAGARSGREVLFFLFALACGLAVSIDLVAATVRLAMGSAFSAYEEFFSSRFSLFHHPSYFAMYLCLAMVVWLLTPIHRGVSSFVDRAFLFLSCVGLVLCGSKMGWILIAVLFPLILVLRWQDEHVRRSLLAVIMFSAIGVGALVTVSPFARDRVRDAWQAAFAEDVQADASTSSTVRRITWDAAITLFQRSPVQGTGTGDIKNALLALYAERGQDWVLEHRLNAHSQYLQSAACLGIPGVLLLLLMLMVPLVATRGHDACGALFLVISAVNWTVESMLEVQAGVVFFAFLAMIMSWSGTSTRQRTSFT